MQLKTYDTPEGVSFHVVSTDAISIIFDTCRVQKGVVYLNTNGYACGQLYGQLADEFAALWNNYEERI